MKTSAATMIIVGEKINSSNKKVASALEKRDTEYIQKLAKNQTDAGADYIDVNAGIFVDQEAELLTWLVKTVQAQVSKPCCIDSPNPDGRKGGVLFFPTACRSVC